MRKIKLSKTEWILLYCLGLWLFIFHGILLFLGMNRSFNTQGFVVGIIILVIVSIFKIIERYQQRTKSVIK